MPAPKGNQFWKARSSHGRKPIFSKEEDLWKVANEYFEWNVNNPLQEQKVFHAAGKITKTNVYKMRAMTIMGLCIFLDISQETWFDYSKKKDFSDVTKKIDKIIIKTTTFPKKSRARVH